MRRLGIPLYEAQCGASALREIANYREFGDARGPGYAKQVEAPQLRDEQIANEAPVLGGMGVAGFGVELGSTQ